MPRYDRNFYIKPEKMQVIDDGGENLGVIDKNTALRIAQEKELDLVLINPQADPPVAKIVSWTKFKYDMSKKRKGNKSKSTEMKEMWFKPTIQEGDLEHKIKRVREFLDKGHKVKLTIKANRGKPLFDKMNEVSRSLIEKLAEDAEPEGDSKREGRNLILFVKPKK